MAIGYDEITRIKLDRVRYSYRDRETILYALGVGFGRAPVNEAELPFVSEHAGLVAVPTMATIFGKIRAITARAGIDHTKVVHGEQQLRLHKPFPSSGDIFVDERVIGAFDKGKDRGAVFMVERVIGDNASGDRLCTIIHTIFARGDGGFGGPREGAPRPHTLPTRLPDLVVECPTRSDQALLYALSGDRNPLHRDPRVAAAAGFDRPILHGLCTYGIACRAILSSVCDYDAARIVGFDTRFSGPVFPGEIIVTELWVDDRIVSFRATVKERNVVVLNNGKCMLAE